MHVMIAQSSRRERRATQGVASPACHTAAIIKTSAVPKDNRSDRLPSSMQHGKKKRKEKTCKQKADQKQHQIAERKEKKKQEKKRKAFSSWNLMDECKEDTSSETVEYATIGIR